MALADLPPPDLFIRTGGDQRISNFLLWQLAYTELWFTEPLWPDLDAATLQRALDDFAARERRFGLTGAQVAGRTRRDLRMTRTRVLAALVMAPVAIAGDPVPADRRGWWLLAALLFLAGLWEWLELAEIEDTLARTVLLVANLALMVALVWGSRSAVGLQPGAVPAGHADRRGLVAGGAAVAGPASTSPATTTPTRASSSWPPAPWR